MNVSYEAACKSPSCKNVLRVYVPPLPGTERKQWCRECDQIHTYSRSDFHINRTSATPFLRWAASMAAAGD
jgi:hypothetical protein